MNLLARKRKRHRRRKPSAGKKFVLESFVTSWVFKIAGLIVLLVGVFYALNSLDILNGFTELVGKLFQPSDPSVIEDNKALDINIIYFFLPGALFLIVAGLIAKRFGFISGILAFIAAISYLGAETYIMIINPGGSHFNPLTIAGDIFLTLAAIGLFINAVILKKTTILNLNCGYFYLSMILLTTDNVFQVAILLTLIIFFTIGIAWASRKLNKPTVNLANFYFAIAIFGLHWLRKLAVNSRTEYMLIFFIYGILFYLLFYAVVIYTSSAKEKALPKWMQLTMTLTNLLFYSGTTAFVIIKYYSFGYLWIFALTLLLLNLLGLLLSGKYFQSAWKLPHHIVTMLLAALILPLLLNQSTILLFMAGISVLFLLYAKYSKNQTSIVISMIAMVIMALDFFFHWIFKYLPAVLFSADLPANTLVVHGIISGVTVVLALTLNNWLLKHIEVTLSKKLFSKTMYIRLMRGLILFTLFLSSGWIVTTLLCYLSGSMEVMAPAWFIAGSLFFILLILLQSNKPNSFYQPILFISLAATLFYPLLVYLPMMETLNNLILTGIIPVSHVLIHHLALGLGIFVVVVSLVRIYKLYPTKKLLRRGLQLFVIIFLLFILCTEYDNLSILLKTSQFQNLAINASSSTIKHFSHNASFSPGKGILEYNRHLPYSIILLATSLVLIFWSLFKLQRFLRNISILLFSFSIVKVFLYDFSLLSDAVRTALFFVIGFLLIGFSVVYPRMKKAMSIPRKKHETAN